MDEEGKRFEFGGLIFSVTFILIIFFLMIVI